MSYYSQTAGRGGQDFVPFSISDEIWTIEHSTLCSFRKDARDHGHHDDFLREADESFVDEAVAAHGVSRLPVPLMVSLSAELYLPCYAVLVGKSNNHSSCWDTYHGELITIMQRVAKRMGVATTLPILYMEVEDFDVAGDVGEDDMGRSSSGYMSETEVASTLPPGGEPLTLHGYSLAMALYPIANARGTNTGYLR
jgi:hypothetical protein